MATIQVLVLELFVFGDDFRFLKVLKIASIFIFMLVCRLGEGIAGGKQAEHGDRQRFHVNFPMVAKM